jgi:hypothetical protein
MAISNVKHIIGEIDGIRCTIVEAGATLERAAFMRQLLEFNNFEVREMLVASEVPDFESTYTIGVTDLVFNPVFAIYECLLKIPEGGYVTPGYWKQECTECKPEYWMRRNTVKQALPE